MFIDLAPSPRETGAAAGSEAEWEDCAVPGYASIQQLSSREREVLHRVAQGHTNARIAEQLRMSVKSVETYRARLSEKLGFYPERNWCDSPSASFRKFESMKSRFGS